MKRPVQPTVNLIDETLKRLPVKKAVPPVAAPPVVAKASVDSASDSDFDVLHGDAVVDRQARQVAKAAMPKNMAELDTLGTEGAQQIGKKQAKTALRATCSMEMAAILVDKQRVSRSPAVFAQIVKHMERTSRKLGRKIRVGDIKFSEMEKPDPFPGQTSVTDYQALWDATTTDAE